MSEWRMASPSRFLQRKLPGARQPPWRVVSAIPTVAEDKDGPPGSHTLGISLMFADGVAGAFRLERSTDRERLVARQQAIEQAPRDGLGIPDVLTSGVDIQSIRKDLRTMHGQARRGS